MKKYAIISVLTVAFLATILFIHAFFSESPEISEYLHFSAQAENQSEDIACVELEENNYYLFIPSYSDLSKTVIHLNTTLSVYIENEPVKSGMSLEDFETNTPYKLSFEGDDRKCFLTFTQSGGVATMHLNTDSGSMEYIHAKKGNEEAGNIALYSTEGSCKYSGKLDSVNGRGNSTWSWYEKKPYSITLNKEADLLGMGAAQKWILLANASDTSNLRNKIMFDISKEVGLSAPDSDWVDLYLNGEYAGLYLLCERNEVNKNRLDISTDSSFLISMEANNGLESRNEPYIMTELKQFFRIHYPYNISETQFTNLTRLWQSVENAIISEDGKDNISNRSWQEMIDLDSWAKIYLIEEISANHDACFTSQYFYSDSNIENGKIFAGPVWDYDLTLGNKNAWQVESPQVMLANRLDVREGTQTPWFYNLLKKEAFSSKMKELYKTDFQSVLDKVLNENIPQYASKISKASDANSLRWPVENQNPADETEYVKNYLQKRVSFLNSMWIDNKEYFIVKADNNGGYYCYYAVASGECLADLPSFESTAALEFEGWYYTGTDEPFNKQKPITENTEVYAKWSAKAQGTDAQSGLANKLKNLIDLAPFFMIAMVFFILLAVNIKRFKTDKSK